MSKKTLGGFGALAIPGIGPLIGLPLISSGLGEDLAETPDTPEPKPDPDPERAERVATLRAAQMGLAQTFVSKRQSGTTGASSASTPSGSKGTVLG